MGGKVSANMHISMCGRMAPIGFFIFAMPTEKLTIWDQPTNTASVKNWYGSELYRRTGIALSVLYVAVLVLDTRFAAERHIGCTYQVRRGDGA